jgi:lysophospholipase L1-like esterase
MAGYNDLWQRTDREAPVEEIVLLMSQVDCAIWVLVPTKGPWARGRARDLETRIRSVAEEHGVIVEPGWRDAVDAGEAGTPDTGLVSPDHVHPTGPGRRKVAAVMADAVDRACPRPSP